MKINNQFILRQLGDNIYVVETINSEEQFNKIVTFNTSSAYLWDLFYNKEFTKEEVAQSIVDKYGIDRNKADIDAVKLIERWKAAGLINQ